MDQTKLNKIIVNTVFGLLIVVPLVIGLSIYSRPEPTILPPPKAPISDSITPTYPSSAAIQYRRYVSGFAMDVNTNYIIFGQILSSDTGQQYVLSNDGLFFFTVSSSTTQITLTVPGYKPKTVYIGPDGPNMNDTQQLGSVYFEPETQNLLNTPVEVFKKVDPQDGVAKLYYMDPLTQAHVKLNDDNIISFKQSPDLKRVAYVFKDLEDGKMGAMVISLDRPQQKTGTYYVENKPDSKITIVGWGNNNCCVVWLAENVKVVEWGSLIQYDNIKMNSMGYITSPVTGKIVFEKVGKIILSPSGEKLAVETFRRNNDKVFYNDLSFEDMMTGVSTGVHQSNEVAELKEFYFDPENRINYLIYYPGSSSYEWRRWNSVTGANDMWSKEPSFWKELN